MQWRRSSHACSHRHAGKQVKVHVNWLLDHHCFTVVVWWLQQNAAPAWVPEGQTQPSTASGNPEKDPKKTRVWETHFSKARRPHSTPLHRDKGTQGMCVSVHQAVAFTIILHWFSHCLSCIITISRYVASGHITEQHSMREQFVTGYSAHLVT